MRCLTLADSLAGKGCLISFICRRLPSNMTEYIRGKGYRVHTLDYDDCIDKPWYADALATIRYLQTVNKFAKYLIVDHYGLDSRWENLLRPYAKCIMVIDDLANRPHQCDVLLDQNYYKDFEKRYDNLIPPTCVKLLGPKYALLRPQFHEARRMLRQRDGIVKRVLIFFGGSDPTNETEKALKAVRILNCPDVRFDVVVGSSNSGKEIIKQMCDDIPNMMFYCQVENMAELMAKADLAIGAGGTATWERCYLGLPTISIVTADNQQKIIRDLGRLGVVIGLGRSEEVSVVMIRDTLKQVIENRDLVNELSQKSFLLMDGHREDFISTVLTGGTNVQSKEQ